MPFINCILFTVYVITYSFLYDQIKWGIDKSFEFLKIDCQLLKAGL
jgi:hypothetical protein